MKKLEDFNIAIIGNCYFDEVYTIESYPRPDDKITAVDVTVNLGGSATNTSAGLVKLELKPKLISVVGRDRSGNQLREELLSRNILPNHLIEIDGKTGRTIILLDHDKNSTKIGYPGVSKDLLSVLKKSNFFEEFFDVIHLASVDIETVRYVLTQAKCDKISLDFGARTLQATNQEILDVMEKLDLAFLNRNVFYRLFPHNSLNIQDLEEINFPCDIVITAGENGLYAKIDKTVYYHQIFDVEVVDTTGAGDATAACIIRGILENWNWNKSMEYASASAAFKIQTYGASNGHPSITDLNNFIQDQL